MSAHPDIARALAALGAESPGAVSGAEAALEWLIGEGGPEGFSEGRLQEFLWFVLPRKFLAPVEGQLRVAASLARVLDLLGLPRYAELCRSPRTEEVLRTWAADPHEGWERARRLVASSAVDPPDVDDLRWGPVMGLWEYAAWDGLSRALELAARAGEVRPGARGWREAQRAVARRWLTSPQPGFESMTPYERVLRERLDRWAGPFPGRRALLEPLVERLVRPVAPPPDPGEVVGDLQWLLLRIRTGVALTAKGNLNRDFVRRAAREMGWRPYEGFEPTGEDDVPPLRRLHELARAVRAVRRSGRKEAVTVNGARWAVDPRGLWRAVAERLVAGRGWVAAVGELALAVLLTRPEATVAGIARGIGPALVEAGWRERGAPPEIPALDPRAVEAGVLEFLRTAVVIRMLDRPPWGGEPFSLSGPGEVTALAALRARGIAPRERP